jgi:hypothetical protein
MWGGKNDRTGILYESGSDVTATQRDASSSEQTDGNFASIEAGINKGSPACVEEARRRPLLVSLLEYLRSLLSSDAERRSETTFGERH